MYELILSQAAAFISGMVASMGLGGGTVLILYLVFIAKTPQLKAQGINLIFFIPCAATSVLVHSKNRLIDWRVVAIAVIGGVFGTFLGFFVASRLGSEYLRKIFGLSVVILGFFQLKFK